MDFSIFSSLISPMIVTGCLIVGYVIKNLYPNDEVNKYIPLIVCVLGIIFNVWAQHMFDFNTIMIGAASGLASTGTYEAFRNIIEKE